MNHALNFRVVSNLTVLESWQAEGASPMVGCHSPLIRPAIFGGKRGIGGLVGYPGTPLRFP